jgi:hypothetical protein
MMNKLPLDLFRGLAKKGKRKRKEILYGFTNVSTGPIGTVVVTEPSLLNERAIQS